MQLPFLFHAFSLFLLTSKVYGAPQKRNAVAAAYFMTNDERGNAIVINDVFSDGTVKYSKSISTGGRGAATFRTVGAQTPDALRTEGSIIISAGRLYNANPGSNTVSTFEINTKEPNQLKMIGKPVNSGGDFPSSIAVSSKTGNVCVLNGGKINGVQCFKSTSKGLVKIANSNRHLSLSQTTPPTNNATTFSTSTILFSPDGSKVLVDVKGLTQQKVPGFLAVWDVKSDGSLSETHQRFPAPSEVGAQNFGMASLHGKEGYIVTDPSVGGIIYDFSKGYGPQARAKNFDLPGQHIVCWVSYASKSNTYFITDFGVQVVFEVAIDNESLNATTINQFQLPSTTVNIDNVVGTLGKDQFLYQLAPQGSSIYVFDIQPAGKTKLIQSYNFTQSLTKDNVKFTMLGPQGLAFQPKL